VRIALIRYLASDAARSQRWLAPMVLFVAACALFNTDTGPLLTTYADTSLCVFPVAVWLTWVVVNSEDAVRASITAATIGSVHRLRGAKLATAFAACVPLAALATLLPLVLANHPDPASLAHVAAGAIAHLVVAAAGVAVGSLLMRSVIRRAGWAFVVAAGAWFVELVVPGFPPVRQLVVAFNADHPTDLGRVVTLTTVETAIAGAVLVAIALRVARERD
jgi:hypothetical protein